MISSHDAGPEEADSRGNVFDARYYASSCGPLPYTRDREWLGFFGRIAEAIVHHLKPSSVFDAGCAMGMLVEALRDRGVEASGADISAYAIANVRPDVRPYCRLQSIIDALAGHFDLITCIEVLEHMTEDEARTAVVQMTTAAPAILFSSTPDDFSEPTHVNVHPTLYWLKLFREHGFSPDLVYDAGYVAPHAILFRRAEPLDDRLLSLFADKIALRIAVVRADVRMAEMAVHGSVSAAATLPAAGEIEARARNRELNRTVLSLLAQLRSIEHSAAWRLVLRYRAWLRNTRARRGWVDRWFEPVAARLLAVLTRNHPADGDQPAVDPPLAAVEPAQPVAPSQPTRDATYNDWIRENEPSAGELELQRRLAQELARRPRISVVVPVYKVAHAILRETIESVQNQTYDAWELCIAHADPDAAESRAWLQELAASDERFKVELLDANYGISGNSNRALALSTGEYIALLDHDDTLAPFALFEVASELNRNPELDFIYSDRDQLSEDNCERMNPLFKPGWCPDLLCSANYLVHLCVVRASALRASGGWRPALDGAQDWDLFLRVIAEGRRVAHIPKVLYHWRRIFTSVSMRGYDAKPYARQAQLDTVREHVDRLGWKAVPAFDSAGFIRLRWGVGVPSHALAANGQPILNRDREGVVVKNHGAGRRTSIILLSDGSASDACDDAAPLLALFRSAAEIVIVPGAPGAAKEIPAGILLQEYREDGALADRLNDAVRQASGEFLVFLDQNARPESEEWLEEMTGPLEQRGIGITGAKMLDSTGHIRHAGICFSREGEIGYPYIGGADSASNIFGSANWQRNCLAVSGACFAIRRDWFEAAGGFSGTPAYPRLDVDLCLRVFFLSLARSQGERKGERQGRILYNPFARAFQTGPGILEQWQHPDGAVNGARYIAACFPDGDPYWSPNLSQGPEAVQLRSSTCPQPPRTADRDYPLDAQALVKAFDCLPGEIDLSRRARGPGRAQGRVLWLVPSFHDAYCREIHAALRFADFLSREHGIGSTFAVQSRAHPEMILRRIGRAFPELAATSATRVLNRETEIRNLPESDAAIATHWTAAYRLLRYNNTGAKFYLLQNDEVAGPAALADATWNFGFKAICNSPTVRDLYAARGGEAEYVAPFVDPAVFFPPAGHRDRATPHTLFWRAAPADPRNSFELVAEAIRILKARLDNKVRIVCAGESWSPGDFGLEGVVRNLGMLDFSAAGALYRACDAGLVMMTTAHSPHLALELMACGSLVIANRNPDASWLLRDRVNCLLSETTPSSIAETLETGLREEALRREIARNAAALVADRFQDRDGASEQVFQILYAHQPSAATPVGS